MFKIKQQLRRLYAVTAISSLQIAGASWVALLAARGFSLTEIGFAEGVFHLVSFLFEVPSGVIADVFGRKKSMVASQCMFAAASAAMLLSRSMGGVCLAMALSALGYNFASGSREALRARYSAPRYELVTTGDAGWLRKPLLYDDPIFAPIFEKCQQLGLIASLTSSFMLGPDLTYSDPDAIQHVALKYPSLKIVVPHGCWPHVHKALALAIRCPNVYLMPDCYLYIPNFPLSEEYVIAANTYLKYRILYASSYPVRSLEQALEGWKARAFTDEALKNTLHDNAARLLGEM